MEPISRVSILAFGLVLLLGIANAYTTNIHAPAVYLNQDTGTLTHVYLNITRGNGTISITGPASVGNSTIGSAQTAVRYATSYLDVNEKLYNFNYYISDPQASTTDVSGPSAGLAFTLLAISGLEHKQLLGNFTVTGTISSNGTVGQIGGIYDKIWAASTNGMAFALVPYAQNGSFENELYYISQQTFGMPIVEVANASQALGYALGNKTPIPLAYNLTVDYHTAGLPYANIACGTCNMSAFESLKNFTLNSTENQIADMGSNYGNAAMQMQRQMLQYESIGAKGYLYSASDLAFLEYINAFTFSNSEHITKASAQAVVQNVSDYCSAIVSPRLTNLNYEYVIGGELRQSWGQIYASEANQSVNSSQTSDELVSSMYLAGSANAWCGAAAQMYGIAASQGGTPVSYGLSVSGNASELINSISKYGTGNLYVESAISSYKAGNYGAAIYDAAYANAFSGDVSVVGNLTSQNPLFQNLSGYNDGIWPTEFALQSKFYLYEAEMNSNNASLSQSYAYQAYTTGVLAQYLDRYNGMISGSFVNSTATQAQTAPINSTIMDRLDRIQGDVYGIYAMLLIILAVLILLIVMLTAMVLTFRRGAQVHETKRGRTNGNRR
jgi:predicted S18 family serine protease